MEDDLLTKSQSTAIASPDDLKKVIETSIAKLDDALHIKGFKFFPYGINSITINVKLTGIEVDLAVSGPASEKGDLTPAAQ